MGIAETRSILDRHGLHLRRELGQNFIVDDNQADRLAELAGVAAGDSVIEVGTGLGVLTRALAARAARVTTLEIDSGLVRALGAENLLPANVELRHADALSVDLDELIAEHPAPVRLVANLPFSAATPLLRRLLDSRHRLGDWSVMVQKELADRLTAAPGSKAYGSFTVLHLLTVDVQQLALLDSTAFFPKPRVVSSFIRIWPRVTPLLDADELPIVERVARAAFSQRRKTVSNALRGGGFVARDERARLDECLESADIDPGIRAEKLAPVRFLALAREMRQRGWV